ncbi:MAG: hypothetical protein K0S38_191 [Candidatus Paceibacter sp.]|jgi:hypothetical protein|nr:hypothetical protein [Candidatus Paceibacter sp.]
MKKISQAGILGIIFVVTGCILFFCQYAFFIDYLTFPIVPGNDTQGHVELGKYFAKHIFPSVWGWAPNWFAGMPFPQFYPPFFYIVVATASKVLPFSYETVFRLVVLFLTLVIPTLMALVATRFTRHRASWWVAALVTVVLLLTPFGKYNNLGISLTSSFVVGLVAHLLAFDLMLLWIWAFFGSFTSRWAYYLSILFLALTALTSIHVLVAVFVIYILNFCLRSDTRKKFLKYYVLPGILAVGLTSFWLIPMLSVYSMMPGQSLGLRSGIGAANLWVVIKTWWPTALFFVVAGVIAIKKRDRSMWILIMSAVLLLVPFFAKFDALFQRLPFHTYRILPFLYFLGAIFAAYVFDTISTKVHHPTRYFVGATVILVFCMAWAPHAYTYTRNGFYTNYSTEQAFEIAEYMKDKQGMYAVEAINTGRQLNYLIENMAGPQLRSNYSIFVESSLSSLFLVPFRSNISVQGRELLSVHSLLNNASNIHPKDGAVLAARAKVLGVQYVIIKSADTKKIIDTSSSFVREKSFGTWDVYRVKDPVYDSTIPPFKPVLVFADLDVKGTESRSLDYFFLQEKIFINNMLDLTIARSNTRLDDPTDLNRFNSAVVTNYTYHSREKAKTLLVEYAKDHELILVASVDPLYAELKQSFSGLPQAHVTFIEYDNSLQGKPLQDALLKVADDVIARLNTTKIAQVATSTVSVAIDSDHISARLLPTQEMSIPVKINVSYFPSWKRTDGEPVYLVTPSYMMTFIKDSSELRFTKPLSLYFGYAVSLLSLGVIGYLINKDKAKK